ncbi:MULTISPECIES: MmyB family transcriptional regulator [Streptomyces violaceusniger group]|uniref:MmyB family transcriptional regulator n=1 Tax=Streptomyces javensis TaxID=114698 RepID=UPI003CD0648B
MLRAEPGQADGHRLVVEPQKTRRATGAPLASRQRARSRFGDSPVVVLGRRSDLLAWNRTGHALFAGHLAPDSPDQAATRPHTARMVFPAHSRRRSKLLPEADGDSVPRRSCPGHQRRPARMPPGATVSPGPPSA